MAVNIVDSYMWQRQVTTSVIKPLALAALKIAVNQVEGRELTAEMLVGVNIKDMVKAWHVEETERLIKELLMNKVRPPTIHCFLEIYARACGLVTVYPNIYSYAMFLGDLAVLTHMTSIFMPSTIAMCCLRCALRRVGSTDPAVPYETLSRKIESAILHSSISE